MKFISPDIEHRYVRKLAEFLDIKFSENYSDIEKSGRTFIIWNPKGSLAYNASSYIKKCNYYKELKYAGKEAYCIERGALPDTIFIDRNGFLFESSSYNESHWNKDLNEDENKKVTDYIENFKSDNDSLEPQLSNRLDSESFFGKLKTEKEQFKKVIFVPLQMHNDTVTLLWCDWVKSVKNFQNIVVNLAKDNPEYLFIIKNHPNEQYKYIVNEDNIKIADDLHYKDCIDHSDCVLTINSSVGLQAMMWDKPVIIVGKAFYQNNNLNRKAKNTEDIKSLVNNLVCPCKESVKKFIYYLKFKFYTTCVMEITGKNCSRPKEIYRVAYENLKGEHIEVKHMIEKSGQKEILFELIELLPNYCLLDETCLECMQHCEIKNVLDSLYFGTKLDKKVKDVLIDNDYEFINNNTAVKDGITIHFKEMPKKTKPMTIYGKQVNVPMPVIPYLTKKYGTDWKTFNLEKKVIKKAKQTLNIVYTFNNYGWVFEFEANYYKKHSTHNIIPIHQNDLLTALKNDVDLLVVPSAWHYERDLKLNNKVFANEIKNKGVKIISQYNSHIEEKFRVLNADLIMPSSKNIYEALLKKYAYKNMAWFPHFIDTDVFIPQHKWNDFTVGFCGNIENRFKRPEVIKKLESDFKFLKKCDYKGHLEKGKEHSDMNNFYNNIDVLVMPSLSEGTPQPILEMMSCGKIVFITDTGISRYLLNDFFIIPNKDDDFVYNEFKNRLLTLQKMPLRELLDIGLRNRTVVKLLDWKKNVNHLDKFYSDFFNYNIINPTPEFFIKNLESKNV